jgi:hypothetical protein
MFVRHLQPVAGNPRIRHRAPASPPATTAATTRRSFGSNHIRYVLPELTLRLTTDAPLTYLLEERPFRLSGPISLILGPDESLRDSVAHTSRLFFGRTRATGTAGSAAWRFPSSGRRR